MLEELSPDLTSLGEVVPPAPRGTLYVRGPSRNVRMLPGRDREVTFGRESAVVDVGVGTRDPGVSRTHGVLRFWGDGRCGWSLHNRGQLPIELPGSRLLPGYDTPVPLPDGYTPMFLVGDDGRHLLEVAVARVPGTCHAGGESSPTLPPRRHRLGPDEESALLAMATAYLRFEDVCRPRSRAQVAELLDGLPGERWTTEKVREAVRAVRERLRAAQVVDADDDTTGNPGSAADHQVIVALMADGALTPRKLDELEDRLDGEVGE